MRRLWLYLPGFLIVCIVGLVAFTLPAHWQIRHITPELPDWSELDVALREPGGPVGLSIINTASQSSSLGEVGHPAVVINWPDGRRFLIDTGMPPESAVSFGRSLELLGADPIRTFGAAVTQLGTDVDTVRGIAFTHLHNDHTDGLPGVCNAQKTPATVFQTTLQRDELNYGTKIGLAALDASACPRVILAADMIKHIDGFPGLLAISLGGHTPGSTLYAVRIGERTWLFSGDITNDRRSMLDNLPKPWWYSALIVPENTQRTAQLRDWLRQLDERPDVTVMPAHDTLAMAAAGLPAWSQTAD